MGGNYGWGVRLDDLIPVCPQYPVAGYSRNHIKLCDFPLVTQKSLLY
jgi:hypothetical protein